MYELVLVTGKQETLVTTAEKRLDAELARERHVRSLANGRMEIREKKEEKSK